MPDAPLGTRDHREGHSTIVRTRLPEVNASAGRQLAKRLPAVTNPFVACVSGPLTVEYATGCHGQLSDGIRAAIRSCA